MHRNTFIAAMGVLSLMLGTSAASALDTLVMARSSEGIFLGAEQVALKQGFFEEEGIDLQFLVATGSAGTTAMMAGEADIAPSLAQFIPAADQGAPLVGFASAFNQFGMLWALSNEAIERTGVTPDAPIEDKIRAFKGLKIGISRTGSTVDVLTRVLAESVGLNPDTDMQLVPVGVGAPMIAALERGDVDGFTFTSPFVEETEFRGLGKVFINLQTGEYAPLSGVPHVIYYTTRSTLETKRDALVRFTRAIAHALEWIQANPDAAEQIMADYLDEMDPDLVKVAWDSGFAAFPTTPEVSRDGLTSAIQILGAEGSTLTYDQIVDPSIVEDALKSE